MSKGPYELQTDSGDRFTITDGDCVILMEAFCVEYDDIWTCLPVKNANHKIWPSQDRGKRVLLTDGEIQTKMKAFKAAVGNDRVPAWSPDHE